MKTKIQTKRVYGDEDNTADGYRVYIDRLWPRGESKERFHYDLWAKTFAPSTPLREWFHADPANRWDGFVKRYEAELHANAAIPGFVEQLRKYPLVTLLYSSRDTAHNNAEVLASYLQSLI